jgi:hypothetical protein
MLVHIRKYFLCLKACDPLLTVRGQSSTSDPNVFPSSYIHGPMAVEVFNQEVRPHLDLEALSPESRTSFQQWLKPNTEYRRIASCFHGNYPQTIIEGKEGMGQSMYFKRCNGES